MRCCSCGANINASDKFAKFNCPECGKEEITRCGSCKSAIASYACSKCGFRGP